MKFKTKTEAENYIMMLGEWKIGKYEVTYSG
jgi:hypothetical protein